MDSDKKKNNNIDIFQRALLKKILKIHYPFVIKNETLYSRVQQDKWSEIIQIRRLSWLGHLLRLDQNTPAQIALQEAEIKKGKTEQGNRLTWIKLIGNDIKNIKEDLHLNDANLIQLTDNRKEWYETIQKTF